MRAVTLESIDRLLEQIEGQRAVIDARLATAAQWSGPLRRTSSARGRRRRVARAFNRLVARARRGDREPLTPPDLLALHRIVAGDGAYRSGGARVGESVVPHPPHRLPAAVETALRRAGDGMEPAPLAAARLHLELALIHPFADGNGRVARLAASWVLLRAGYRSTLLTAVEQHPRNDPAAYARGFVLLTRGGLDTQRPWLQMALGLMAAASEHAAATRRMQHLNEAYAVLRDPAKRRTYDATLPPAGQSAWDVFLERGLVGMFLDRFGHSGRP